MTSKFFLASAEEEITLELNRKEVQDEGFFSAFIDYPKEDKYNKGSFEIFYTCADNVSLKRLSQNETPLSLPCNSIHKIKKDSKLLEFKDFSKNKNSVEIFINLYFREKDSNTPSEIISKSVIINPADYSSKNDSSDNNTGEVTNYEITAGERSENTYSMNDLEAHEDTNSFAQADLVGEIIEFGYIDKDSKEFISSTEVPNEVKGAVRFSVENIGTKITEDWSFSLVLPTQPKRIFRSDSQRPLAPGERIEYTIGFDKFIKNSEQTFTLNIDPTRNVNEKSKDNNIIKEDILFTTASSTEE